MEFGFWGFIWNRGRAGGFDYLRRIDIKKTKIGRIDLGEVCLSQRDWIRQKMIGRVAAQLQTAEFGKSVHHLVFFSIAAFPSGQLADIGNWEQKAFCFWMAALPSGQVTDSGNSAQKAFCFAITFFPSGQLADSGNCLQKSSNDACLGSAACCVQPTEDITMLTTALLQRSCFIIVVLQNGYEWHQLFSKKLTVMSYSSQDHISTT